jgi:hypothetical protein
MHSVELAWGKTCCPTQVNLKESASRVKANQGNKTKSKQQAKAQPVDAQPAKSTQPEPLQSKATKGKLEQ